jgi:hypothetical protein
VAQVLCTGVNPALLTTRKFILERAAHTAVTATNEQELTAACEAHQFDVAVIGQGVSPAEKRRIASLVRDRCPGTKVLELYSPHTGKMLADADEWLVVPMDVPCRETPHRACGGPCQPENGPQIVGKSGFTCFLSSGCAVTSVSPRKDSQISE